MKRPPTLTTAPAEPATASRAPDRPATADGPTRTEAATGHLAPDRPDAPDQPTVPDRPSAPDRPQAPPQPEPPDATARPDAPDQPDALDRPDAPERPAAPAPPDQPDLDQLGDRIAELSARIQAATYDLLCDLREFDRQHGWEGFRSCAHWLSWRTGLDLGAAREKVRVANALADLNHIGAAMACGILSYSKVRALSRVASPATEARLLAVACGATAEQVERLVRGWRRLDRAAAAGEQEEQAWLARRGLSLRVDEEGMVVVRGRLLPEVGAVVQRALEAALEQVPAQAADGTESSAAQRRADALGVVAESALAGKLDPGTAGDRYQVTVHVDAAALVGPEIAAGAISAAARSTRAAAREPSAPAAVANGSAIPDASAISAETRSTKATAPEGNAQPAAAAGCAVSDARAISAETRNTFAPTRKAGAPPAAAAGSGAPDARAVSARTLGTAAPLPERNARTGAAARSAAPDARAVSAETSGSNAPAREAGVPTPAASGYAAPHAAAISAETRSTNGTAHEACGPAAAATAYAASHPRAISAETRSTKAPASEGSAPAAAPASSVAPDAAPISAETRSPNGAAHEACGPAAAATAYPASHPRATSAETPSTDRTAPHATPATTGTGGETVAVTPTASSPLPNAKPTDAADGAAGVQLPDPPAPLPGADSSSAGGGAVIEQGDGLFLSTAAARRIACDAGRVLLYHAPDGTGLDVGRRTRTIPTPLRRALEGRDRQRCQFPGCENRRCDAHHLVHWADGGATRLENLVLVCRFHHRAVHEEGFEVIRTGDGRFEFRKPGRPGRPDGAVLPAEAAAVRWEGAPLAPTEGRLAAGGIRIGPHTATPEWYGESLDVAAALDVLWEPPPAAAS